MTDLEHKVQAHYARLGLLQAILDGAHAAGADLDALTPETLAPVDEFHTAGRTSTLEALRMMSIEPGMHLLDAGCGIGGTSRCLASERGCRVTGLDLTPEYVETARQLTTRMGLDDRCSFERGSVLQMPFANATFDGAVSFHVAMNIEQRAGFYAELARVLRPDAELCIFDVMKGPGPGMRYPVPWAESAQTSFLRTREETAALLDQAGFALHAEQDLRAFAIEFFARLRDKAAAASAPPPLGLHLLTGANSAEKFANYSAALQDHQIEPVIMVARRV
ncbi:MAG: class I SAM-dependent methyltransferase [Gammaproteobacteria bacterium]|nr:class I SAM-dependent methyltransferase [Gammaproteobacteria bacterium]